MPRAPLFNTTADEKSPPQGQVRFRTFARIDELQIFLFFELEKKEVKSVNIRENPWRS
jgi:hypothetical protein